MENQTVKSTTETKLVSSEPKNSSNLLSFFKKIDSKIIKSAGMSLVILIILIGGYYWYSINQRTFSDKAEIFAPLIIISPSQPSILQEVMVKNGDQVSVNQPLAKFDNNQFVRAKTDGIVVNINDEVGKIFSPGMPVVTMVNQNDLRLIVHVAENKGLNSIRVGQKVVFTVDAFDSRKFYGSVEEIAQTSDQSSVVFSISDKRDEKYFSIKVKFDDYPELLNGMSAKAWIYR